MRNLKSQFSREQIMEMDTDFRRLARTLGWKPTQENGLRAAKEFQNLVADLFPVNEKASDKPELKII